MISPYVSAALYQCSELAYNGVIMEYQDRKEAGRDGTASLEVPEAVYFGVRCEYGCANQQNGSILKLLA